MTQPRRLAEAASTLKEMEEGRLKVRVRALEAEQQIAKVGV